MSITKSNDIFNQVDLSNLKHFFAVATYGGFSKAGRATGVSQPGLSLGLQKLEKALGIQLVDRNRKEFALTHAGLEMLNFCQRLEGNLSSVVATLGLDKSTMRKRLKIGTALSIGFSPFARFCAELARSDENLDLELTTNNTYQILNDLTTGGLDAALVPDDVHDSTLSFHPIVEDRLVFVVGRKLQKRLSGKSWRTALELVPLITYPRETPLRALVDRLCLQEKLRFHTVVSVNSLDAIKMLVSKGAGGAFVLHSLVRNELEHHTLTLPNTSFPQPKTGLTLATRTGPQGHAISKTVRAMIGA